MWYGVVGNHDYADRGLNKQYFYNNNGWRVSGFFWSHTMIADNGKELAFVHIDTSYLAYGSEGEIGNKRMTEYFQKNKWDDDTILEIIEKLLIQHKNATYKFVIGHHPIGHVSGGQNSLPKVEPLLKKYGF